MSERIVHLKIKIKSLADEAKTIRVEANKTSGMAKWRLNDHRTGIVRSHARLNLLAYGILTGMPYERMEKKCYEAPNFNEVSKIALRFGGSEDDVSAWVEAANEKSSAKAA